MKRMLVQGLERWLWGWSHCPYRKLRCFSHPHSSSQPLVTPVWGALMPPSGHCGLNVCMNLVAHAYMQENMPDLFQKECPCNEHPGPCVLGPLHVECRFHFSSLLPVEEPTPLVGVILALTILLGTFSSNQYSSKIGRWPPRYLRQVTALSLEGVRNWNWVF